MSGSDTRTNLSPNTIVGKSHIVIILIAAFWMAFTRLRRYRDYITEHGIFFAEVRPYYQYRTTEYTVENWPWTLNHDLFLQYPDGRSSGAFGTLYDQFIATIALIIGGGNPSEATISVLLLVFPVVFGVLTIIPVYFITKQITDSRRDSTLAVFLLALLPGIFFLRTTIGFASHDAAAVFLQGMTVLAVIFTVKASQEEVPTFHLLFEKDISSAETTVKWAVISGVLLSVYIWVWPPAILMTGVLVGMVLLWAINEVRVNSTPEPVGFAVAGILSTSVILLLPGVLNFTFDIASVGLLQITGTLIGIGTILALMKGARIWNQREEYKQRNYGIVVGSVSLVAVGIGYVLSPTPLAGAVNWYTGEGIMFIPATSFWDVLQTQEQSFNNAVLLDYGLLLYVALLGLAYLLLLGDRRRADYWFVGLWAIVMGVLGIVNYELSYYLALPVAIFTAYTFGVMFNWVGLTELPESFEHIEGKHIAAVGICLILIIPVLVLPIPIGGVQMSDTAYTQANELQPTPGVYFADSMEWMNENTPAPGTYGGADNEIDYHGDFQPGESVGEGGYSVLAWGGYSPLITTDGERIPHNTIDDIGGNYWLSTDEEIAEDIVESDGTSGEGPQYVVVDWQMIHPEHGLTPLVNDYDGLVSPEQYANPVFAQLEDGSHQPVYMYSDTYYDSLAVQLYLFHGSGVQPQPVVVEWDEQRQQGGEFNVPPIDGPMVQEFDSVEEAREYAEETENARLGGIGGFVGEEIEALEHYRLADASQVPSNVDPDRQREVLTTSQVTGLPPESITPTSDSWSKTFERVPGATVNGEAPSNTTVLATVEMEMEDTGERFVYQQQVDVGEDGEFEMTVPYASTGYDEYGPEDGYTDVSVTANRPYQFTVIDEPGETQAHVSEAQVIGEDETPVEVEVEIDEDGEDTSEEDESEEDGEE